MAQVTWPVVSLLITAYPAAHWLNVTREGWRPNCQTQSARGVSSLARGPRRPITVAGKHVCVCVHTYVFLFHIKLFLWFQDWPSSQIQEEPTERLPEWVFYYTYPSTFQSAVSQGVCLSNLQSHHVWDRTQSKGSNTPALYSPRQNNCLHYFLCITPHWQRLDATSVWQHVILRPFTPLCHFPVRPPLKSCLFSSEKKLFVHLGL